jgi:spoIIIJ-associated protein
MNPYERRIIHAKVAEIDGVGSRSVGEDPYRKVIILPLDENGNPLPSRRGKNHNNNRKDHSENRGEKKNGYRNNHNNNGGNRNNHNRKKRQSEEIPHKPTNFDDIMSTSFEKDYRKPKPEDDLQVGLYGKIE